MSAVLSHDDCPWAEPVVATGKGCKGAPGWGEVRRRLGLLGTHGYVYLVKIHCATLHLLPSLYVCYNLCKCVLKIVHA